MLLLLLLLAPALCYEEDSIIGENQFSVAPNISHKFLEDPLENEPRFFSDYSQLSWSRVKQRALEADWWDISLRTIALDGIDLEAIFQRLVTPRGLITQYALSIQLEIFQNIGWIISGLAWNFAVSVTTGEIQKTIKSLDFLLGPTGLALTMIRSTWNRLLELLSRLSVASLIFGIPETIAELSAVSLLDIGNFIFSTELTLLSLGRGYTIIFWLGLFAIPVYLFSTNIYPNIRPGGPNLNSTLAIGSSSSMSNERQDNLVYRDYYLDPVVEGGGVGGYQYEEDYEPGKYKAYQSQDRLEILLEDMISRIIEGIL